MSESSEMKLLTYTDLCHFYENGARCGAEATRISHNAEADATAYWCETHAPCGPRVIVGKIESRRGEKTS